MQNVNVDSQIDIAWRELMRAVANRDLGKVIKMSFWLKALLAKQVIHYDSKR